VADRLSETASKPFQSHAAYFTRHSRKDNIIHALRKPFQPGKTPQAIRYNPADA
jgi:hypothetical protein